MNNTYQWLDDCEARLLHPDQVSDLLLRAGWAPLSARSVSDEYRRRFNEHALGYSALLVSIGIAALGAGTAGHTLVAGLDGPVNRSELAVSLTGFLIALPFAGWGYQWAAKVDRTDPVAVWSRPRRNLALVLLWACAIVGGVRLLSYGVELIGALVRAPWAARDSLLAGAINVGIAIGIALPLGIWAFRFLHRFDPEDPTAPPSQRTRRVGANGPLSTQRPL